jgi:hypothetical protein
VARHPVERYRRSTAPDATRLDTLIVAGGSGTRGASACSEILAYVQVAPKVSAHINA